MCIKVENYFGHIFLNVWGKTLTFINENIIILPVFAFPLSVKVKSADCSYRRENKIQMNYSHSILPENNRWSSCSSNYENFHDFQSFTVKTSWQVVLLCYQSHEHMNRLPPTCTHINRCPPTPLQRFLNPKTKPCYSFQLQRGEPII